MAEAETNYAAALNAQPEGWVRANAVRFLRATASRVEAELELVPNISRLTASCMAASTPG